MNILKLIIVALCFVSASVFAQVEIDVFEDKVITNITKYDGITTIVIDGFMENPDNCDRTDAYITAFGRTGLRFFSTRQLGNTRHGGDPSIPINMQFDELLPLQLNATPIKFRLEGCILGFPVVRWVGV